jgi:putative ABC transport system permease protein
MLHTVLLDMLTRRLRLTMTALAIALGVAFMSGSFVFSSTLSHSLASLFATASTGTDVIVQHASPSGASVNGPSARPVPASVLTAVRSVSGVAAADGTVSGNAVLLAKTGRPMKSAFGVALSWPADPAFQTSFTGRSGSPPVTAGQVMIDRSSATTGGYRVGQVIGVAVGGRAVPFTISGITGYGSGTSIGGGSMAVFSVAEAQRLFGLTGSYDTISVAASPGVPASVLRDRIASVLPSGVVAVTAASAAANEAQQLNSQLSVLTDFFLGFAGIALFTGAFVIWNTFSIMVGQRTRALALMRALGASRGQVFGSVLLESLLVGAVASVLGVALGLGLAKGLAALLSGFGVSLPLTSLAVPWGGLVIALAAGVGVTLAASVPPAYRATRVPPVAAMRAVAVSPSAGAGRRRLAAGLVLIAAGSLLLVTRPSAVAAGAGAVACFAGVTAIAPALVRPLAAFTGWFLGWLPGRAGTLARDNTAANTRRAAATAASLMIGLAVISGVAVLVSSARSSVSSQISAASKTPFYVQATNSGNGLDPALASALAAVPGVTGVTETRLADASVNGAAHRNVTGVDPSAISSFTSLGLVSGSTAALSAGGIMVTAAEASAAGWHLGSLVPVQFGSYGSYRLPVAGIFTTAGPLSGYIVSLATFTADSGIRVDNTDLVRAPSSAAPALRAALAGYPGAQLQDQAGYVRSQTSLLNSLMNLVTALLVLAIIIALLGVVNTLALSIVERTREIGLLRAIGMGRGQVRLMIAAESVIISVIGALLGTMLGLGMGVALASAITHGAAVTIPYSRLIIYILATGAAGVLASIAPARRAARLNVLAAIASE